jgi:plasmid stability protein
MELTMTSITIRKLEDGVKTRLRMRAAKNGRSMEAEARDILSSAVAAKKVAAANLGERIRSRFASAGYVKLYIPKRQPMREPRFPAK